MGYIRIEARTLLPADPLGFEGSQLYFHYAQNLADPSNDPVISVGASGSAGNWGVFTGEINLPLAQSDEAYPANDPTGSIRPFAYITAGFFDPDAYWANMVSIANSMLSQSYAYNPFPVIQLGGITEASAPTLVAHNANSFITSMLYHMGLNPATSLPPGLTMTVGISTLLDIAGAHTLNTTDFFTDIFAGDGNDTVNGGADDNFLFGGSGNDKINGGSGNDVLLGETGADVLIGGAGDDFLFGSAGIDVLRGMTGYDVMVGGGGADTFDFNAVSESTTTTAGADAIADFQQGFDKIDFSDIDADSSAGGNQSFVFIGTDAFTAPGQIRYTSGSASTVVQINVTGTNGAEMTLIVKPAGLILTAADFIL